MFERSLTRPALLTFLLMARFLSPVLLLLRHLFADRMFSLTRPAPASPFC